MGFFSKVTEMSWANPGIDDAEHSYTFSEKPAKRIGLTMFLAVVTSMFFLFVMAYSERMELGDWDPMTEPGILWLNTALLVLASIAMQRARRQAGEGVDPGKLLFASGLLALGFIGGQALAWSQLAAQGYYSVENPAYAFFLLLTALHAIHLLGGLYVWSRTVLRQRRGATAGELAPTLDLCAIYWHYLLLLWVVLFVLMLTT